MDHQSIGEIIINYIDSCVIDNSKKNEKLTIFDDKRTPEYYNNNNDSENIKCCEFHRIDLLLTTNDIVQNIKESKDKNIIEDTANLKGDMLINTTSCYVFISFFLVQTNENNNII